MTENIIKNTRMSPTSKEIVRKAIKKGYKFKVINEKKRCLLTDGAKKYKFTVFVCSAYNTKLSKRVTVQKEVTSRLLRAKGHNAPENMVFEKNDVERAWNWAKTILPVVIKPYNGTRGNSVYTGINNKEEFVFAFGEIANKFDSALVEKMEKGEEYRFAFLNGEIVAVTKRVKAHVIGDGKSSIEQLIEEKNILRVQRKNPIHKPIKINENLLKTLNGQNLDLKSVPKKDEIVILSNKMNIADGSEAVDYTDKISDEIKIKVAKAAKSIRGLRIAGLDVLVNNQDVIIIEINSDPNLLMHEYPWEGKPRDVVNKLLDQMF